LEVLTYFFEAVYQVGVEVGLQVEVIANILFNLNAT